MNKVIIVVLLVVGLVMQFRTELRGLMGLAPLPENAALAQGNSMPSLQEALAQGRQPEVIMYATPTCPYCEKARRFMDANGVSYREYNVNSSRQASQEMREWGGRVVPTIVIDREQVLRGWNQSKLTSALVRAMTRDTSPP